VRYCLAIRRALFLTARLALVTQMDAASGVDFSAHAERVADVLPLNSRKRGRFDREIPKGS